MADDDQQRVLHIIQKLATVRASGKSTSRSDRHKFQLNPPLAEAALAAFEAKHGIRLPADYRAFLKYAGNGGAGPYYGIFPLEKWDDFAKWIVADRPNNFLGLACPLRPEMKRDENWQKSLECQSPYQGTIALGSQGCTYEMLLVISGLFAGRVVYADADGQAPYMVHDRDFLSWYERWLDELLGGYGQSWFGFGPGGGEDDFFRLLDDPESSDTLKTESAFAFCRLPKLSPAVAARIGEYCAHPLDGVRAGTCATIRKFKIIGHVEIVAQLLADISPAVRREAVTTAMELDPQRFAGGILARLYTEPDSEAASAAFLKLKDTTLLSRPILLRIINESALDNLRYLAAHSTPWTVEDIGLLLRLISDPHKDLRLAATNGLRSLKIKGITLQIIERLESESDEYVVGSMLKLLGELGDAPSVPTLLEWTKAPDDFHRLDALDALEHYPEFRSVYPQ